MLPPAYPGYLPYCPYTVRPNAAAGRWIGPDLAQALRLVDASHTRGMRISVYGPPGMRPALLHVVSALRDLHYRARFQIRSTTLDNKYFDYVRDSRNRVQAGFFGWVAGGVSAGDTLAVYRCSAFTPASNQNFNPAEFCDPSIDALMDEAIRRQASSSVAAGNDLWAEVEHRIIDAAPWIPLVTPSWVDVFSTRVHNYQRSPVAGVFYDQMWVR
jgi:peptide/nickel transport system substrate-binding protein